MFRRIRLRLILWYASVLAVVLLAVGGLLYFAMWQTVMGPVNGYLTCAAGVYAADWQTIGHRALFRHAQSPCDLAMFHSSAAITVRTPLTSFQGV